MKNITSVVSNNRNIYHVLIENNHLQIDIQNNMKYIIRGIKNLMNYKLNIVFNVTLNNHKMYYDPNVDIYIHQFKKYPRD